MKVYVIAPPAIQFESWRRRYATALIVIALVGFTTLGVGIAQMLYSSTAPRVTVSGAKMQVGVMLDQHERHR